VLRSNIAEQVSQTRLFSWLPILFEVCLSIVGPKAPAQAEKESEGRASEIARPLLNLLQIVSPT